MGQEKHVCCKCSKTISSQHDLVLTAGLGDTQVLCSECYVSLSDVVTADKEVVSLKIFLLNLFIRALIAYTGIRLIPFPLVLILLYAVLTNTIKYLYMRYEDPDTCAQSFSVWQHENTYHGGQKYGYKYMRTIL